jgi:hypothetical protein
MTDPISAVAKKSEVIFPSAFVSAMLIGTFLESTTPMSLQASASYRMAFAMSTSMATTPLRGSRNTVAADGSEKPAGGHSTILSEWAALGGISTWAISSATEADFDDDDGDAGRDVDSEDGCSSIFSIFDSFATQPGTNNCALGSSLTSTTQCSVGTIKEMRRNSCEIRHASSMAIRESPPYSANDADK